MGVDLATYRARIGCFQNPTPRSVRCWSQASALLVGVILAQIWDMVTGDGQVLGSAFGGLLPTSHQTEVQTYQLHCHPQSRCCFMMSCLLVWFMMLCKLLLQAGDIEQNPGPMLRETDTDETEEQSLKPRKNDDGLLALDLSGRKMSSLPEQVFQQNDIQVLKFQCNIIKAIPTDIGLLFRLRHLDISYNKLSHLPDSMSSLSNLEELNMSGNTIQEFPNGMENMQALKVLIYRNNSLVTIPEQVFSFPIVEELDVSDNELTEVSPLIGNLLSLKVLNLRWNQSLQTLPQELCQLSDLEELNLSVCDLGYLPGNISNLKKIRILQLSCNRISSLPESVFKSLVNLEELNLCDNSITEIPESISNLKKLKHLKVSDNQLVRLPSSIAELTELQTLDVACNSITSLPHNFEDLVKIVHLNLKHNQISLVPFLKHGAFPALQEIHLTGNPIQLSECQLVSDFCMRRRVTMCVDHRQYVHLMKHNHFESYDMRGKVIILLEQGNEVNASSFLNNYIDLSNQRLSAVPYGLDIHDPSTILLSNNRIQTLPISMPVTGHSKLRHLDLSHNLLSAIPEEIHLLSNLRSLKVSHNKLQSIPPGVYELLSLKNFNMSYNSVQLLPPTKFPNMEHLDLSYNKFQMIPEGVLQTQSLIYLNLLGNNIASLSVDIARLTNLNTFCWGIKRPQNLSHVSVLKTLPWKNTEWTVNIKCNDNPTSARTEAHFIARIDAGYLQVIIGTKEVTEGEFDENLRCGLSHICKIDWLKDTIREVDLSNCSIQDLPEYIFYLPKLTSLDVSNNKLSGLPSKLVCLQSLKVLNVSNCSLTALPDSIGECPSLTRLDIPRNNLKVLPNSISLLSTLEHLSLYECGCHQVEFLSHLTLKHVEVDLPQLISIRISCLDELSAAGTTISLIQDSMVTGNVISIDELGGPVLKITPSSVNSSESSPHEKDSQASQPLTSISISDVHITGIFNLLVSILCTQNLQVLKVSNCSLTVLPDSIGDFPFLTSLDLSKNQLKDLPNSISHLSILEVLNVSDCSLTALPDSLGDLQSLTSLDISGNPLKTLPSTILHMSALNVLNVSNCSLIALPDSIGDFSSLTSLDISRNDLKILLVLSNLSKLEKLSLQYCGCHHVEFLSHLSSLRQVEVDIAQLICIRLSCIGQLYEAGTNIVLQSRNLGFMINCHGQPVDVAQLRGSVLEIHDSWFRRNYEAKPPFETDIQVLTSLTILNNTYFNPVCIPEEVFSIDSLKELKLSGCCLESLPETIQHLSNLTYLDLSNNRLSNLPKGFGKLKMLQILNFSNCASNLSTLSELSHLISNNVLETFSGELASMLSLTVLNVSLNYITDMMFPVSMAKLSSLQILTMFHCGCYQMDFLSELMQLKELTVDFWQLVSIQRQIAEQLPDSVRVEVVCSGRGACQEMLLDCEGYIESDRVALEGLQHGVVKLQHCDDHFWEITPPDDYRYNGDIIKMDFDGLPSTFDDGSRLNLSVIHTLQELILSDCNLCTDLNRMELPLNLTRLNMSSFQCDIWTSYHGTSDDFLQICQQSALQELTLSDCGLHCVPEDIGQLVNLMHLDLSRNRIEDLPDELCNITSLKWLSLQHNELFSLPERIGNLFSLEYLDASMNMIDYLPNAVKLLNCMSILKLFHCGCYQMDFLSELKQLTELTVDFWQLVSIKQQTAKQLSDSVQIKVIYSDHDMCCDMFCQGEDDCIESSRIPLGKLQCGIIQLQGQKGLSIPSPSDDFRYSGDIIKIDLNGSRFVEPILKKIGYIHTLQELVATNCDFDLNSQRIELPSNLLQLDVSGNHGQLQCICQQSALQMLNMSSCGLFQVTVEIGQLQKLTQLDLSRNRIEYLPDELCNITSLRWLSLQDNTLSNLPVRIGNLQSMEYLDVSLNKFASMPDSFRQLSSIHDLRLSQCGCCYLAFLDEFTEIKILEVDFWQLLSIPQHTLMQLPGLLKLFVSSVTFEYEKSFHRIADCAVTIDLDRLKQGQLNFHNLTINSLSTPPHSFIHGLTIGRSEVDRSYNIQVLPSVHLDASSSPAQNSTYSLDLVKYLDLSHNKLREIPEALSLLSNLTHLDISNNIITGLPRELVALKEIESFFVNHNKIVWERFIDITFYRKLKHIKFDLIDYPPLDNLPSSLISVTVTLCDGQINHIADIDWDIQTSRKPHKYFDFVVRSLQGIAPGAVTLPSSDLHTISPIVLSLPQGSERVHSLLLSDNSISEVPSDIFNLLQLQHLDLSRNKISSIPDNLWKLPNLQYIDASFNKIKEITEEIAFAKKLTTLFAQGNEIAELPQSISTLPLLEELCVFSNDIIIFKTPSVFSMITLKHLKIDLADVDNCESHITCSESLHIHCYYQNKSVIAISAKIFFEQMPRISMLLQESDKQNSINLAGFGLVAFPGPIISHPHVEAIDLSQNEIRYIPEEISRLHHLQKITLSQNGIQHFPQYLHLCTSLKHLDLYLNAIQSLPDDIREMKQIQYLNLSSNSLKCLPMSIGKLQQLEELVLEYNQIEELPDSIGMLEKLSVLRLSANCMRAVPSSVGNLLCLKQIDLSNNKLESIPEVVGSLKNVVSIDISGNSLSMLPSSICGCHSLESMKLSSNMLSKLPDNIDLLENLTLLQASMNRLSVIPPSICRLQCLQTLDVSVNNITELPGELGDLSSLTALNVGSNHLKDLPESFTKLVNLTSVDISSNDLKAIPEEMFEFVNMTEFNIAGNKIETLPNTICELQNLEYLSLEENNIRVLPTQFGKLHKLRHFGKEQILDNPMEQPPIEVFEQGMEGVVAYFEELNLSKAIEVPRVKALLLGEVAAGKTSLCNAIRLGKSNLTDIADRTAGIEVHPTRLQDSIQVLMHDFGGHKIYHLTHQFFFSNAALYLIVVDLKAFKRSSFAAAVKYWLNVIKARIDSKPVLRIVGTHIDLCDPGEIKEKAELIMKKMKQIEKIEIETLNEHLSDIGHALNKAGTPCSNWCYSLEGFDTQSLKKRWKFIEHLIDNRPIFPEHIDLVSCDLSLDGIKQLTENIVMSCQNYKLFPRRILPKSWFELELAIKSLKQDGHLCYLSMDDVQKIAKEKANMTSARLTRALKYLHDIGEIVHFSDSPQLSNFIFHKPQWLMDVFKLVYKPVERFDERFASVSDADFDDMVEDFSSRGLVSEKMIRCLWKQMNLSKEEESMLICLLQKFDLCFQMPTPDTENADPYIPVSHVYRFPWLLKASAPRLFRQCWKQKISSDEEVLMVVFQLQNYCPVGLFETLSVKLNKYIICREDWQCGLIAVSKVGENKILVQLEPKQSSEEIVISVRTQIKDLKEAWAVMVLIINATKELLQQWPGVLYCVRVVCPHCLKKGEDKPHRFSGAVLDKAPGGTEWCPKTMEKIDPRLIHPEISPAQWQQRRKRTLEECGKSPAPEEVMMEKQPRYSEQEPDISVRNNTTVHATCVPSDCNAQNYDDTENVWERFRSMAIDMQPQGEGNRLATHLMESGLTLRPDVPKDGNCLFHAVSDQLVRTGSTAISHSQLRQDVVGYLRQHPHNEQGDHLRVFVPNEDWEGYLQQMSRGGVWGDHIVLQALASMLGRDIRIVSSIDADNYTTILTPMGNQQVTTGPPLLLGHYAENHYASLDVCHGSAVLLISDEYGTSKGGISTINHQLAQLLRCFGAVVYCSVLWVTAEDEEDARKDGVHLIRPSVQAGDARNPSLDWLTYDHRIRYPNLPKDVGYIVGHGAVTDKAAENIKNSRYPQAKLYTFNHTIPEDTEHYKGGRRAIKAWEKETDLLKIADVADAVFSVGRRIYNHFETMYKGDKKPKAHHLFLPKPSKTFENTHVKSGGEQKVVLSIGRVKNAEQLKGHDLAARTMGQVAEIINNVRWRVRGINEDDFEKSKKILEDNLQSGRLKPTLQPYGTQKEISDDMKMAHLVLMPSRSEPFGLVGLEAIAAGIPVLISSQSGLADLIKELIKKGKCHPDLRHRIVETSVNVDDLDTDARKWTEKVVDTLRWNDEEFQKAALFKQQLQESMYWEESHQIFIQACGITNALT